MTHYHHDTPLEEVMTLLTQQGCNALPEAFRILMNEAMKVERAQAIQAEPYERSEQRQGYANGFKPKTLQTRVGPVQVEIPQVRGMAFYPQALERGVRSERALKLAIAEMYLKGVSTRKVTQVMEQLCGFEVTSTQVSRAAQMLDEELEQWRNRSLAEVAIPYLVLDARYEKVRHAGAVISCAVLIASGVGADGKRTILGVSASLSEAEIHWRNFLKSLQDRGLHGVRYIVSDDHKGLTAALAARFPNTPWQRCQFHLQQNAGHHVPRIHMRKPVAQRIRDIFNAPDKEQAELRLKKMVEDYSGTAPQLAEWLEENIPEGLTVFNLPAEHRRRMRTTNALENINRQLKRRTKVAGLFPNEASLLRLVSALLMEWDEEFLTGRTYLNMQSQDTSS